jgi:hypothetical protein
MHRPSFKMVITSLLAASVIAGSSGVYAFHDGGVGECEGCHTMHNSYEGMPLTQTSAVGIANKYLLKGNDQSSVCLNCHQKAGDTGPTVFHVSTADTDMPVGTPPRQMSPGGDFGWLKKNYTWMPSLGSATQTSTGDSHGHNIVAQDYGYFADAYKNTSPGGSYPAASLGCTSCHDPHGKFRRRADGSVAPGGAPTKGSGSLAGSSEPDTLNSVGVYRLLGGVGYNPKSLSAGFAFNYNPPAAIAPDSYNRSESVTQTRVAYGAGMSDWCRNCHANIHTDAVPTPLKHPAGSALTAGISDYYDRYIKDGDLTGIEANAYLSLVPFEVGTSNYATLKSIVTMTPSKGPSTSDGTPAVMCLSCHRAHASGWDNSMRWNNKTAKIVHNGTYSQESDPFQPFGQGRNSLEAQKSYYDIPATTFTGEQNPLCYKCHVSGIL